MPTTDPAQPARVWPPTAPKPGHVHLHLHQRNVPQWIIDALDAEAAAQQISRGKLIVDILQQWAEARKGQ